MQMRRGGAGAGSANQEEAGRQCRPIRGQDRVGTMRTSAPTLSTYLVDYLYFILAQALPVLHHAQSFAILQREKIFLEKEKRREEKMVSRPRSQYSERFHLTTELKIDPVQSGTADLLVSPYLPDVVSTPALGS